MKLARKRIIITGASRGIGYALAERCLEEGATVGLNYLASRQPAQRLSTRYLDTCRLLPFDVTDNNAVTSSVQAFVQEFGGIDALINNAGIYAPGFLISLSEETIRRLVDVLLLGPIFCTRAVLPIMVEATSGVILNISSAASVRPSRGQTVYAASKAGIEGFTRAIAIDNGHLGIRAISLRLGPYDTDMFRKLPRKVQDRVLAQIPIGHLGDVRQVAEFVVYLLTDAAEFITGTELTLDGGYGIG
jgi:3-oxoacyl-[acyl-carrier protein] reductase